VPSLREVREHIRSVESISKVTKALEVVSVAKRQRLEVRIDNTQGYAQKSWAVLAHLAEAAGPEIADEPLFRGRKEIRHIGAVLITSQRGMAGAYDHNVVMRAQSFASGVGVPVAFVTIGRVGREAMLRQGYKIHADLAFRDNLTLIDVTPLARLLLDSFVEGVFDRIVLIYTQFHSGARLEPTVQELLPIVSTTSKRHRSYIYEPSIEALIRSLVPRVVRFQLYQALLESFAAENASRAVAMRSATQNAQSLLEDLSLSYNKARQQAITEELRDLLGGSMGYEERG